MRSCVRLSPPSDAEFAPFGRWIRPPLVSGDRLDLGFALDTGGNAGAVARAHVNHVRASTLPTRIASLEQHPRSWQAFLPFDVARYIVVVAGKLPDGGPDPRAVHAFLLSGTVGVAYAPGTWHAGATVLDRAGHFTVLWPRAPHLAEGGPGDTIRADLPEPIELVS